MSIISYEFRTNKTIEGYKLEQYYYDTRYQILFFKRMQYPFTIIAEAEEPHEHF